MGKPKFDKNKGVTFKLVYRDEEQVGPEKTLSERIFSVIEDQKVLASKENDTYRQKILSQFTKEELGQAPKKKIADDSSQHNNNISSHTKGREDLWITHLMRMKEQARRQAKEEEEESEEEEEIVTTKKDNKTSLIEKLKEQGFKKLGKQQAAKIAAQKKKTEEKGKDDEEDEWEDDDGEDGEWEDEDEEADYDVEEEWEEEEEEEEDPEAEEYEEFNDEEVDAELAKMGQGEKVEKLEKAEKTEKKKGGAMEEITITKAPIVKVDDFPTLGGMGEDFVEEGELPLVILPAEAKVIEEKVIEEAAEEPMHLDKIEVQGDIRMKRYDDLGLPMDGYNYYQHIAPSNAGGAPTFQFEVTYDHVVQLPADKDAERNKLNAEEKELYDALDEEDAGAYEDLEDDFFEAIIKGSNVKLGEKSTTVSKPAEKVVKEKKPKEKEEVKKSMLPKKIVKEVVADKEEYIEILPTKDEILAHMQVRKEEKEEKRVQDKVYKKMEFQKVLNQHLEMLKDKYKDEREKNKAKYQIESSEEEEVDDDVEEVDSFASLNEDNKEWVEKLPYAQDEWAQKGAIISSSEDERDYEEEVGRSEPRNTRAPSEFSFATMPVARKANLNIIKEDRRTKKDDKEKETTEKTEKKEDEEDSETGDDEEDDEEEEDGKGKVEEVFKKREKGETKEEKKARKEAIKQFKKERKEKKKNFKDAFEHKRKEQVKIAGKHAQAMQGLSIHKLTI